MFSNSSGTAAAHRTKKESAHDRKAQVDREPFMSTTVLQLVLASLPLFGVLCYLLYEAAIRPSKARYQMDNIDDDATIESILQIPLIPLGDMLICFLCFEFLFMIFFLYLLIFIPRRHALVRTYLSGTHGETLLGDVFYQTPTDSTSSKWNFCNKATRHFGIVRYQNNDSSSSSSTTMVQKRVRLYLPYTRERTTIIKLAGRPYSGLPKADLEHDLQKSINARPQILRTTIFALIWLFFLILSPLFLLRQIYKVTNLDPNEDYSRAWKIYVFAGLIGIPLLCLVGVVLRWSLYRHWVVNRGRVEQTAERQDGDYRLDEADSQDEGVVNVFMTEMTGRTRTKEVRHADYFDARPTSQADQAMDDSYVRMEKEDAMT